MSDIFNDCEKHGPLGLQGWQQEPSIDIAKHARQSSQEGKSVEACPFNKGTQRANLWLAFFEDEQAKGVSQ